MQQGSLTAMGQTGRVDARQLCQFIIDHFSENELQGLCFELDISFADLPGATRSAKARRTRRTLQTTQGRHRPSRSGGQTTASGCCLSLGSTAARIADTASLFRIHVDRKLELQLFSDLLHGARQERILLIEGPPGLGKTSLMLEYQRLVHEGGTPYVVVDLGSMAVAALEVLAMLREELVRPLQISTLLFAGRSVSAGERRSERPNRAAGDSRRRHSSRRGHAAGTAPAADRSIA